MKISTGTETQSSSGSVYPDLRGIRRWPSEEAREWVERFTAAACADPEVDAVVAIGSSVREIGHGKSDIDLLVIYSGPVPPRKRRHIEVDVREVRRDHVDQKVADGHDLLGWAVQFGVPICDHDGFWAGLRNGWTDRVPLPSCVTAEARSHRAEQLALELLTVGDEDAAHEQMVSTLTHRGRARLLRAGVYPASRPELPRQLRAIDEHELAGVLADALEGSRSAKELLDDLRELAAEHRGAGVA